MDLDSAIITVSKQTNIKFDTKKRMVLSMSKIFGYARISRKTQNIERQIRNITSEYPKAEIYQEAFTGTKADRPQFNKLLKKVKAGDTIIFDSVSRMSRNATEGIEIYFKLYEKGVNLVFLKESYINTEVYKNAVSQGIEATGNEIADIYIDATNKVIRLLATQQIEKAFEQAEKEVTDLHERTKEGIETARRNGKQIGQKPGSTLKIKKKEPKKAEIKKYCRDFDGSLSDKDTMKMVGLARNTYYKYKKELIEELNN